MSSGPTPELQRHHQVMVPEISERRFHPAWRIKSRLDRLLADQLIAPKTWLAAVEYRRLHEIAHRGAVRSTIDLIGTGRRPQRSGQAPRPEYTEGQLAAVRRLATIREALGAVAVGLIEACVVADMSWCALGRRLGIDHKTTKKWTVTALNGLVGII
jgi:hypothetical protein